MSIVAGGQRITGLADGVNPQDAATVAQLGGGGGSPDFFGVELANAVSLCAFVNTPIVVLQQTGLVPGPNFEGQFTSGTASVVAANVNGGGLLLSTNAGANSVAAIFSSTLPVATAFGQIFDGSGRSFCAFRFKLTTVPDTQTVVGMGVANGSGADAILVGVQGSGSTAQFRLFRDNGSGNGVDSGLGIDTNWHTGRLYTKADGNIYGQFDSVAAVSFVQAYLDNTQPNMSVRNGTTAANQEMIFGATIFVADGNV
jgi:hypothetical protein